MGTPENSAIQKLSIIIIIIKLPNQKINRQFFVSSLLLDFSKTFSQPLENMDDSLMEGTKKKERINQIHQYFMSVHIKVILDPKKKKNEN